MSSKAKRKLADVTCTVNGKQRRRYTTHASNRYWEQEQGRWVTLPKLMSGRFFIWDEAEQCPLYKPYPYYRWFHTRRTARNWLKKTTEDWYKIQETTAALDGQLASAQ